MKTKEPMVLPDQLVLKNTFAQHKTAEVLTPLQPHQQRVVERIQQQPGLVVAHGLGSGKTLSSIAAAEALGGPTTVLVPAALRANYEKEIAKHVDQPQADYDISSLQGAARSGFIPNSDLLIVDEAHRLRDPATKGHQVVDASSAAKRLLLTGTPLYNKPADLASLVNIAARRPVLPEQPAAFEARYLGKKTVNPSWFAKTFKGIEPGTVNYIRNRPELQKILKQWVDYHENSTEGFPARKEHVVETPMSGHQSSIYESVLGTAPPWLKYKVENKLPLSKAESKDINAFANAVRQVAVSPGGFDTSITPLQAAERSPKITKAFERFSEGLAANPGHKAVIYSNYLEAGLKPYEALLQAKGIPYGTFTGEMKKKERDQLVKDYNEGRINALLVSSAGGEGLDLKGTRQIQILDPHWNKEKLEQVIGRGIRYKSHAHLPEDQRNVDVEHYVSTTQEPGFLAKLMGQHRRGGIDEYLRGLSEEKDMLNQQIKQLLRDTEAPEKRAAASEHEHRAGINDALKSLGLDNPKRTKALHAASSDKKTKKQEQEDLLTYNLMSAMPKVAEEDTSALEPAIDAETPRQMTERHIDDLGIALLASPYAAELLGQGLRVIPYAPAQGLGTGVRAALGKDSPFGHSNVRELAGLALVAPTVSRHIADAVTSSEP
jgi:superfamily II DNA or RNA helicase